MFWRIVVAYELSFESYAWIFLIDIFVIDDCENILLNFVVAVDFLRFEMH